MSYHEGVSHKLQDDDRHRPQIHVPIINIRLPVRVRTSWKVTVEPHIMAEHRLSGYPDCDQEHHHAAEERIK
jgi:hypothetical protein